MKKQSIIISLTNPCNENWENMTASEKGRHCASCNKTVVDFSLYTDKQLIEFFKTIKDNVCGHIPKYQLERVISVQQPNRFSFLRKLALGTGIAAWFGLSEKADAQQNATPHPVTQADIAKAKTQRVTDSLKNIASFSFYDAKTNKPIQFVYCTINGVTAFTGDSTNHCKVSIPDSLIGKKASFYFYSNLGDSREMKIDLSKLPLKKKIYLTPAPPVPVMVNGGLGMREINEK